MSYDAVWMKASNASACRCSKVKPPALTAASTSP